MQAGATNSGKGSGATVVQKAAPPPTQKEAAPAATKPATQREAPRITSPGAFFVGHDVHIYARKDSLVGLTYNDFSEKEPFAHFGPVKLLDASFDEHGQPLWGLVEYKEKNARKYLNTDLIPLHGCSISLVQVDENFVPPTAKDEKEEAETKQ